MDQDADIVRSGVGDHQIDRAISVEVTVGDRDWLTEDRVARLEVDAVLERTVTVAEHVAHGVVVAVGNQQVEVAVTIDVGGVDRNIQLGGRVLDFLDRIEASTVAQQEAEPR